MTENQSGTAGEVVITKNDFAWLAQTFQKNGEQCQRTSRDETMPPAYRHQMYGQAQLYLTWADIFREWREGLEFGSPPNNTDNLRQLHRMLAATAKSNE